MPKDLSKQELIKMYETVSEDILRKLGVHQQAKEAYEEKAELQRLMEERVKKAKALVKVAQELLNIYGLDLTVTKRGGISIKDKEGKRINIRQVKRKNKEKSQRLSKGLATPRDEYIIPILESIAELGGNGRIPEILQKVKEKMIDVLTEYDMELEPEGNEYRWRKSAQWARYHLTQKGLLSDESPRGVWEITDAGRKYLQNNSSI